MFYGFRAPLGAMLVLVLGAGAASAGSAVSSADMIAREGPGDEFKMLWTVPAGSQVDIRECNPFQWCFVTQREKQGWVHVRRVDEVRDRKGGGAGTVGSDSSDTTIAELPGDQPGKKGGKRKSPAGDDGGNDGISPIDGASLPGNNNTGGGRTSSSSSSSSSSGDGPGGFDHLTTKPAGGRF